MDANNEANTNTVTSVQRKAMCVDQSYKDSVATRNDRHSYGASESDREQGMKHSLPSNGGQAELEATSNRGAIASLIYHDAHMMPYR